MSVIEFRKCKNCINTGKGYICIKCVNYSNYRTNKDRAVKVAKENRI